MSNFSRYWNSKEEFLHAARHLFGGRAKLVILRPIEPADTENRYVAAKPVYDCALGNGSPFLAYDPHPSCASVVVLDPKRVEEVC
jgi:hypothetical protein